MSTDAIPTAKWRAALAAFLCLLIVVILTIAATLLGIGNPPRAGELIAAYAAPDNFAPHPALPFAHLSPLDGLQAPFTLELAAENSGPPESAWGIDLVDDAGQRHLFIIDNQGSIATDGLDWRPFIHARAGLNALYVHVERDGRATFRINGEIAWTGQIDAVNGGVIAYAAPELVWRDVRVYRPDI